MQTDYFFFRVIFRHIFIHYTCMCVPSQVLIGHIKKKMVKQTFSEHCSLCREVLPFSDHKQTVCENGHMWLRYITHRTAIQL